MDEYEEPKPHHMECKYHVVFIPKCRRRTLYQELGVIGIDSSPPACAPEESRRRALDARSRAHAAVDPAETCGVAGRRVHQGQERDPHGSGLWRAQTQFRRTALLARGFFVNTVGRDDEAIRAYIRNQEKEDQRLEQMNLWR